MLDIWTWTSENQPFKYWTSSLLVSVSLAHHFITYCHQVTNKSSPPVKLPTLFEVPCIGLKKTIQSGNIHSIILDVYDCHWSLPNSVYSSNTRLVKDHYVYVFNIRATGIQIPSVVNTMKLKLMGGVQERGFFSMPCPLLI